jgi:hypothetical protein
LTRRKFSWLGLGLVLIALGHLTGCSLGGDDSPREAVIKLFGAMERDDRAAIAHLVDLPRLMGITDEDYALQTDEPRVFYNPADVLNDLTGDGLTKTRWFSMQRVIGRTEIQGDTAYVEVSFINKKTDVQYYNKFGLHKVNDRWRIFSFKTMSGN